MDSNNTRNGKSLIDRISSPYSIITMSASILVVTGALLGNCFKPISPNSKIYIKEGYYAGLPVKTMTSDRLGIHKIILGDENNPHDSYIHGEADPLSKNFHDIRLVNGNAFSPLRKYANPDSLHKIYEYIAH
jgi:hypothetical protein